MGTGVSVNREAIRGLNTVALRDQGKEEEVRKADNRKKIEICCLGSEEVSSKKRDSHIKG